MPFSAASCRSYGLWRCATGCHGAELSAPSALCVLRRMRSPRSPLSTKRKPRRGALARRLIYHDLKS